MADSPHNPRPSTEPADLPEELENAQLSEEGRVSSDVSSVALNGGVLGAGARRVRDAAVAKKATLPASAEGLSDAEIGGGAGFVRCEQRSPKRWCIGCGCPSRSRCRCREKSDAAC